MADKYLLRVTAGSSYDPSTHTLLPVNTPHPTKITSSLGSALISVRIQNYHGNYPPPPPGPSSTNSAVGLPPSSPTTSPYFSHPSHTHDKYSISFHLQPSSPIPGSTLVFGNDFSHPVRDRLPPGFHTALRIVKWTIDPGLDGDVDCDRPYLYGNALSSLNILRVFGKGELKGEENGEGEEKVKVLEEGGEGGGEEVRRQLGVPEGGAQARKSYFLGKEKVDEWVWEEGRVYGADFFNPYLDFNEFTLKLPGFSLSILKYLGGEDYLRYVLKRKDTNEIFFVVQFTLVPKAGPTNSESEEEDEEDEEEEEEEEEEDYSPQEQSPSTKTKGKGEEGKEGTEKEKEKEVGVGVGVVETSPSDLD